MHGRPQLSGTYSYSYARYPVKCTYMLIYFRFHDSQVPGFRSFVQALTSHVYNCTLHASAVSHKDAGLRFLGHPLRRIVVFDRYHL